MGKRIDRWKDEGWTNEQIETQLKYEKQWRDFWKTSYKEKNKELIEDAKTELKESEWKVRNLAFDGFWIHRKIPHLPNKKESRYISYNNWKIELQYYTKNPLQ